MRWDTKILPDITGKDKVDRIPVIISQRSGSQLLGIPKISSATGAAQANAVYTLLENWGLIASIIGLSFDTTASNTGILNGACTILEQEIGRTLLPFACRHHIFEIIVGKIVTTFLGPTNGPTLPIFIRFRKAWKTIDKTKYSPGMNDEKIKNALKDVQDDIIIFCQNEMKKEMVRHDYQELLQLVLIFLGGYTKNVSFRELIAIHQARWMANLIYAIKMFLFRDQFEMTSKEMQALRRIIVFTIRCHVKAWFQSTDVIKAPNHDLCFVKELYEYRKIDAETSKIAIEKFCNHLWYLNDEFAAFALYDPQVSMDEKRKMAEVLLGYINHTDTEKPPANKRYPLKPSQISNFCKMNLHEFITPNTVTFFDRFNISTHFLTEDPSK